MPRDNCGAYLDPVSQFRRPRTPEQLEAYYANQQPNPKHVKILRAGIAEFRRMLEARYGQKNAPALITPERVGSPALGKQPAMEL